jgi:amino acid permease
MDISSGPGGHDQRERAHVFIFTYLPVAIFVLLLLPYKLIKRTERKPLHKMTFVPGYLPDGVNQNEPEIGHET